MADQDQADQDIEEGVYLNPEQWSQVLGSEVGPAGLLVFPLAKAMVWVKGRLRNLLFRR